LALPAAREAQVLADLAPGAQLLVLAHLQVPPHPVVEARLLDLAHLLVLPHPVVEVQLPVLVLRVLEAAAPVQRLLSSQLSSAAMARSTTWPPPTYEPVPRSR